MSEQEFPLPEGGKEIPEYPELFVDQEGYVRTREKASMANVSVHMLVMSATVAEYRKLGLSDRTIQSVFMWYMTALARELDLLDFQFQTPAQKGVST